ncbi:hypothetical protein BKA62DRAFT_686900 [Auriculariales sp. MPI-PUGE-AT-0066]|nr:hypothetical protein BKA62DRAFT_686900 [Auriculariales sp. MPI-PUGE-AT-0066]
MFPSTWLLPFCIGSYLRGPSAAHGSRLAIRGRSWHCRRISAHGRPRHSRCANWHLPLWGTFHGCRTPQDDASFAPASPIIGEALSAHAVSWEVLHCVALQCRELELSHTKSPWLGAATGRSHVSAFGSLACFECHYVVFEQPVCVPLT